MDRGTAPIVKWERRVYFDKETGGNARCASLVEITRIEERGEGRPLNYWRVTVRSLPEVQFAHIYTTRDYRLTIPAGRDMMQIGYIVQGAARRVCEGRAEQIVPQGHLCAFMYDAPCRMSSDAPVHSHWTVSFSARIDAIPIGEAEAAAFETPREENGALTLVMPESCDGQLAPGGSQTIREIIRVFSAGEGAWRVRCASLILALLSEMSDAAVRMAQLRWPDSLPPSGERSVRRARAYIAEHLSEPLSTRVIAAQLNISEGYLANLFAKNAGMSVTEAVAEARIRRVRLLMDTSGLSLKEAGRAAGLEDEHYLSRQFKRYTGMSARQYRAAHVHFEEEKS